ncbi:MAG: deoxyribonuclease IV [Patescibacteria group bacterium]
MLFGAHVSIAGGIENAPLNAAKIGCEVFQFFSRSPRGGNPTYTEKSIKLFHENFKKSEIKECYIHTPYYINLASANNRIRYGSISAIRDELEIATKLGVKYVMTHLGSAKDFGEEKSIELVAEALDKILNGYIGTTELLIENSAGSGNIIGGKFEEISDIIKKMKNKSVGICFDTCHAFASGYDLRTASGLVETLKYFDRAIGLDRLRMFHFNDSKTDLGTNKDRHEDIGEGLISIEPFKQLVRHPGFENLNAIIETPGEKLSYKETLILLKSLRI